MTLGGYTFHSSCRCHLRTDEGFFGWASTKMTAEYISTPKAAVINVVNKLAAQFLLLLKRLLLWINCRTEQGDESEELWDELPGDVVDEPD